MDNLKIVSVVLSVCFGIAFLDGMFGWGLAEGFYILVGLVDIVFLGWLLKIAFKK
jgi:hypothetical protein